jgi:hypothetical protein
VVNAYRESDDPAKTRLRAIWLAHAEAPGWYSIRSEGAAQTFMRRGDAMRMSLVGKPKASCGWAYDLPEPIALPEGARLEIEISGSAGARYFVDLMGPKDAILFQTLWQDTPTEPKEAIYPLPAGKTVARLILYTMTMAEQAHNDWRKVTLGVAGQEPLATFIGPPEERAQ